MAAGAVGAGVGVAAVPVVAGPLHLAPNKISALRLVMSNNLWRIDTLVMGLVRSSVSQVSCLSQSPEPQWVQGKPVPWC